MYRIVFISLLLFVSHAAHSKEAINKTQNVDDSSGGDLRQLVSMPDQARELMRKDMLDHLSAFSEFIGYLASNNLDAAPDISQARIDRRSSGTPRATGMGPDRCMRFEQRHSGRATR